VTLLGYPASCGQQQIVGSILNPNCKRIVISAMTRYGKTRFAAIGLLLLIANTPIELNPVPKRIIIIAPRVEQTKILRNYISQHIAANQTLSALLDEPGGTASNRIKKETSKRFLTFKNGWEILTLTAHAGKNEQDPASNLMGWGGDIIVLDEACLIRQDVYTSRISRMLGDNPEHSKLIILANPWSKSNFVWEAWQNPAYKQIQIGWQQALAEGRTAQTYLDEQRSILSPYEWKVLYESEFADESEDTLIRYEWIQQAVQRGKDQSLQFTAQPRNIHGLDVAEHGVDKSILTDASTDGVHYIVHRQTWIRQTETMACANQTAAMVPKTEVLNVDDIGVGAGVRSRLAELGYKAVSVRVSSAPTVDVDRYLNLKSQKYWHLRTLFEQGNISIPDIAELKSQLSKMSYKFTAAGKIQIIDPAGKSPDYADSLMLTLQPAGYHGFAFANKKYGS